MKHRSYPIAKQSISTHVFFIVALALVVINVWLYPSEDLIEDYGAIERNIIGYRIIASALPFSAMCGLIYHAVGRKWPD